MADTEENLSPAMRLAQATSSLRSATERDTLGFLRDLGSEAWQGDWIGLRAVWNGVVATDSNLSAEAASVEESLQESAAAVDPGVVDETQYTSSATRVISLEVMQAAITLDGHMDAFGMQSFGWDQVQANPDGTYTVNLEKYNDFYGQVKDLSGQVLSELAQSEIPLRGKVFPGLTDGKDSDDIDDPAFYVALGEVQTTPLYRGKALAGAPEEQRAARREMLNDADLVAALEVVHATGELTAGTEVVGVPDSVASNRRKRENSSAAYASVFNSSSGAGMFVDFLADLDDETLQQIREMIAGFMGQLAGVFSNLGGGSVVGTLVTKMGDKLIGMMDEQIEALRVADSNADDMGVDGPVPPVGTGSGPAPERQVAPT